MPDSQKIQVKCPHCGAAVKADVTDALTPDAPELKLLFAGKLNNCICPECGKRFAIDRPLVFRDSENPYILFLATAPEDGQTEPLEQECDALATEVFQQQNKPRPVVRIVFSKPDFLEKIAIHRLGFDDRLIEYSKLQLFRNIEEPQLSRSRHRLLFDYSHCDDENLFFLIFDREDLQAVQAIQVPMSDFRALEEEITRNESLLNELDAAFPGCYVSADRLL